jgi:transposase
MLYNSGMTRLEIAPKVGVSRNTVGQWIKAWKKGGRAALKVKASGRPKGSGRKLYPHEEQKIRKCLIDRCPDQLKLPFALWTRQAVQELIKRLFGIEMTLVSVGRYLKSWGFTPQKPIRRAYERNDERVRIWLEEEYPSIAAKAKHENAEIHWGDETGLRSDDVNGRSYAPQGKTPVQRVKGTPEKINMISTVTNRGQMRFMFYKQTMTAQLLMKFIKRLIRSSERKIFLILDNLRVHHSKVLKEWLVENKAFVEVFYLPSYSPDLNPDELMNSDLKSSLSQKPESKQKGELEKHAKDICVAYRNVLNILWGFFKRNQSNMQAD